jgi:toxin ParE1/3/4
MKKYRLAPPARSDLAQIWSYLAQNGSPDVADRVIDSIFAKFPLLAKMPNAGRARTDIDSNTRSFPVGNYVVYYRRRERSGIVISRVLHAMRDQQRAWRES